MTNLVPRHLDRALQDPTHVRRPALVDAALSEREEVAHDLAYARLAPSTACWSD